MKSIISIISFSIIFSACAFAGILWDQTFGGSAEDAASDVQPTLDGGFILTGYSQSFGTGNRELILVKTDSLGNCEWNQVYGGGLPNEGKSVTQTFDGGFLAVGCIDSFTSVGTDLFMVKTDVFGNEEWRQIWGKSGNDGANSIKQTSDGGFIIVGYRFLAWGGGQNVWVIKIDENGNKLWDKAFGGWLPECAYDIEQTIDDGFILTGYQVPSGENKEFVWLVKIDALGNEIWKHAYEFDGNARGYSIQQTADEGYVISGSRKEYSGIFSFLLKTDALGNEEWHLDYTGSGNNKGYYVLQADDNGYIVVGSIDTYGAGSSDVLLYKTDSSGYIENFWTFGGPEEDFGCAINLTNDGNLIIAGITESYGSGNSDLWLLKCEYPHFEGEEWIKTYGGTHQDYGYSLQQTADGGIVFVGSSNGDVCLVKADSNGNTEWYKTYGDTSEDSGDFVQQTADGGFIIGGSIARSDTSYLTYRNDAWLIRTDASGNKLWDKVFQDSSFYCDERVTCVQQTTDGGFILTSNFCSEARLIKTDADGNEIWNRYFYNYAYPSYVLQTDDNGYILVGSTSETDPGLVYLFIIKTGPLGFEKWSKIYGDPGNQFASCIQPTSDGNFIIVGGNIISEKSADIWLIKIDPFGNIIWDRTFGGTDVEYGYSVKETSDLGFIITGEIRSFATGPSKSYFDLWLLKTDSEGNEEWNKIYGGPKQDVGESVIQLDNGGYMVCGTTISFGSGGYDTWLIYYNPEEEFDREITPSILQK